MKQLLAENAERPASTTPSLRPENIPHELRGLPQWVCWRYELRGEKWTKVPYTDADSDWYGAPLRMCDHAGDSIRGMLNHDAAHVHAATYAERDRRLAQLRGWVNENRARFDWAALRER